MKLRTLEISSLSSKPPTAFSERTWFPQKRTDSVWPVFFSGRREIGKWHCRLRTFAPPRLKDNDAGLSRPSLERTRQRFHSWGNLAFRWSQGCVIIVTARPTLRKMMLQTDTYTKVVLTIIAFCLVIFSGNEIAGISTANASGHNVQQGKATGPL